VTNSLTKNKVRGSYRKSKDYDVGHVDNEFVVEDAEDSDENELILWFKQAVPTKPQTDL